MRIEGRWDRDGGPEGQGRGHSRWGMKATGAGGGSCRDMADGKGTGWKLPANSSAAPSLCLPEPVPNVPHQDRHLAPTTGSALLPPQPGSGSGTSAQLWTEAQGWE